MWWYIALITVCLLVYWWLSRANNSWFTRETVEDLIQASNGTFDAPAKRALQRLNNKSLTPQERLQRASIIRYNIYENEGFDHTLAREYQIALWEQATSNIVPSTEYMDQAYTIIEQTPDDELHRTLTYIDEWRRRRRQRNLNQVTNNRIIMPEQTIRSDPQNVHDSAVTADLRQTLELLDNEMYSYEQTYQEIANLSNKHKNKADILKALNVMYKNNYIRSYKTTEMDILAKIWTRASHPDQKNDTKGAVLNALADSVENGVVVCANGRCARVLNSLAAIDKDGLESAMTLEAYKQQIYKEIQDMADKGDVTPEKITNHINTYTNLSTVIRSKLILDCIAAIA